MPDTDPNPLPKILTGLRAKAEELLLAHDIYDINSYGWLDHDTPDPDFFGHAIYQTQPPFELDWGALLNGASATYFPTTKDETLVRAGEDFVGTMVFARRSFGIALCYAQHADTNMVAGEEMESYWREFATTLHWLNVASDRLRDYFVMAQFGQSGSDYNKAYRLNNGNKQPTYSAPFQEAAKSKSGPSKESLGKLAPLSGKLQKHRTERNILVHQIASLTAKQSLELLYQQRESVRKHPAPTTAPEPSGTLFQTTSELIESSIKRCKDWYVNLVKASSLVFEVEYFSRKGIP